MKLIREYYELCDGGVCQDLLTEAEKKFVTEGGTILSGLMQEAEVENGNGRKYPLKVLVREVENYKRLVQANRALGELDHPDSPIINLNNASHIVTDIWMDGPKCFGKIKVLPTPSGEILSALCKAGVQLGISSRGLGSLEKKGNINMVQDDFQLICFDMVSDPSTPNAFMHLKESKEKPNIFNKGDKINRALNDILYKFED
tara:strand:+ start:496 stop:1101 length:606 start_codon:yes stop_codon:yes gene_type:complete